MSRVVMDRLMKHPKNMKSYDLLHKYPRGGGGGSGIHTQRIAQDNTLCRATDIPIIFHFKFTRTHSKEHVWGTSQASAEEFGQILTDVGQTWPKLGHI